MARATTKKEIVRRIAESLRAPQKLTHDIVQALLDEMIEELARGNRLEFREFGVFAPVMRKARLARNPRTGETVSVPEHRTVHFKAGKKMKLRVRENTPPSESRPESPPGQPGSQPESPGSPPGSPPGPQQGEGEARAEA